MADPKFSKALLARVRAIQILVLLIVTDSFYLAKFRPSVSDPSHGFVNPFSVNGRGLFVGWFAEAFLYVLFLLGVYVGIRGDVAFICENYKGNAGRDRG